MHKLFGFLTGSLLYLELVYHLSIYGFTGINPMLMLPMAVGLAALETCFLGISKKRNVNLTVSWVVMVFNMLLFAVQIVYTNIFTQPLMLETALTTGADAITDFWSVALHGIINSILPLLFLIAPMVVFGIFLRLDWLTLKRFKPLAYAENAAIFVATLSITALILIVNYNSDNEFYVEYQELYAPENVAKNYGMLALYERQLMGDILPEKEVDLGNWTGGLPGGQPTQDESQGPEDTQGTEDDTPQIDTSPNILNIDFDKLMADGGKEIDKLAEMMQQMTPSKKNEYTGMFEGYNLIYLTAEGFSPYAVSEELTPTLYKMLHSGFVVEDYYVPLWQTSTSDGEYVNMLGQIPDGQHSFRRSQKNAYPYSLAKYFEAEGVKSYAYHNNSLSYYDRHLTHPNLGYDFKAAKLGKLSAAEYGSWLFDMKGANSWPNSDYDMMVATIPEFINQERFHAYYMTLSGHAAYTWAGNHMSSVNRELVQNLDCSEQMKAYIACNLELERAMKYLVEQLEAAGKLDKTVIVLSADHYPYGLDNPEQTLEEFVGHELSRLDVEKNCLIMWNSAMETVKVDKTCSALDIMPTILNLFGFDYDSRLFAGRDMLSDSPSFVVFKDRSFITDEVIYDAKTGKATSRTGGEVSKEYISSMKSYVKAMFAYSAGCLNDNFHDAVGKAVVEEAEE